LVILLAQPDAETAIDGMHKVAQVIVDRAQSIRGQLEVGAKASLTASG
jgi:hypothetical protein